MLSLMALSWLLSEQFVCVVADVMIYFVVVMSNSILLCCEQFVCVALSGTDVMIKFVIVDVYSCLNLNLYSIGVLDSIVMTEMK